MYATGYPQTCGKWTPVWRTSGLVSAVVMRAAEGAWSDQITYASGPVNSSVRLFSWPHMGTYVTSAHGDDGARQCTKRTRYLP